MAKLDPDHNHEVCIADAVATATEVCRRHGVRLTPIRQRVLELIWRSHGPIGAYAVLDLLRDEGKSAAPPTVYRALDFLLENGLVHRLATLNAFVGCANPLVSHQGQYLICRTCGTVDEIVDARVEGAIAAAADAAGFHRTSQTVEVSGYCSRCATATQAAQ